MSAPPPRYVGLGYAAAACEGKEAFTSPGLAHTVKARRQRGGKPSGVYRCACCNHWHIGTPERKAHHP